MKSVSLLLSSFVSLLFTASSAGSSEPPVSAQTKQDLQTLAQNIQLEEAKYGDLIVGSEKLIRWYQDTPSPTEFVLVYIHGFSASRQELSPVTEMVADQLGANVFYTRLTGHGRSDDAMAQGSIKAWQANVQEAYQIGQRLGKKVILISTSTGATLATWLLAQTDMPQPFANIMISPNYAVKSNSASLLKWSWGLWLAKLISGDYHEFTPVSEQHGLYWTERYPLEAVVPMMKLLDVVDALDKSTIHAPQLIIYSPKDEVIEVDKVLSTSREFTNSKVQLHAFTESTDHVQHVLAGVACSPESTDRMIELMTNYIDELSLIQ